MVRTPGTGPLRILRGSVCALVGILLGALAHEIGGAHPPGWAALLSGFVVLALVGVALAEHRRGFGFIAVVLCGGQLFLHFLFSLSSAPRLVAVPGGAVATGGHGYGPGHEALTTSLATGAGPITAGADVHASPAVDALGAGTAAMTLGHLIATVVAAACLAYGEQALWRLAGLVIPLLAWRRVRGPVVPSRPRPVPVAPLAWSPSIEVLLARCAPRRGPPVRLPV